MYKLSDLRDKEVINIKTGTRLGLINDMVIDTNNGFVRSLVIPGPGKILGFIGKSDDVIINWSDIQTIGNDFIIVNINAKSEEPINKE